MNPAVPVVDWPEFAAAFADVCVLAPSKSIGSGRWPELADFNEYLLETTPERAHLVLP